MRKIVIVEDIKIVLQDIVKMVTEFEQELEICGTALDAITAISIIESNKPDIVLTDIRMPKMDGMELISKVKHINPKTKFIIISGYAEFEYARESLKLGVSEYILKPVKREELYYAIKKAILEIEKEEAAGKKIIKQDAENALIEILSTKYSLELEKKLCDGIGQNKLSVYFSLLIVHINRHTDLDSNLSYDDPAAIRINEQEIIKDSAGYSDSVILSLNLRAFHEFVVLISGKSEDEVSKKAIVAANNICHDTAKALNSVVMIGMGTAMSGAENLQKIYSEAARALQKRFFNEKSCIFIYECDEYKTAIPYSHHLIIESFEKILDEKDKRILSRSLIQIFRLIFSKEELEGKRNFNIRLYFVEIIMRIAGFIGRNGGDVSDFLEENAISGDAISRFDNIEDIVNYLVKIIEGFNNSFVKATGSFSIDEVKGYVDKNYDKEISLSELAVRFSISPNYLCNMFKKNVGISLTNYVNAKKIEYAKVLLENSKLGIDSIAETLGFNSAMYFFRVFKKYVGSTPSDYRTRTAKQDRS